MYSIKGNGNNIANEFKRLIGNSQTLSKTAKDNSEDKASGDISKEASGLSSDNQSDNMEDMISDLMVEDDEAENLSDDAAIESHIDDMQAYSSAKEGNDLSNSRENYILSGLSKISANLRAKGEGFAADVVEATANSIRSDFTKEADRKRSIVDQLNKMAKDFSSSGDQFAADMVSLTINKISN